MNPNLFVYGTLLSSAGHPMGNKLRGEARLIGPATISGQMYRVGLYPGLVEPGPSGPAGSLVHGEVYALDNPVRSLAWLDAYESVAPGANSTASEYLRAERRVRLGAGQETMAWVYIYQWDPSSLALVPDGRWLVPG